MESKQSQPIRATVATPRAIIRSGHPEARLPGPPWGELSQGSMVRLLDRSPLKVGKGQSIDGLVCNRAAVEAALLHQRRGHSPAGCNSAEARRAQAIYLASRFAAAAEANLPSENLPAAVAADIKAVDEMHRSIRTQSIDRAVAVRGSALELPGDLEESGQRSHRGGSRTRAAGAGDTRRTGRAGCANDRGHPCPKPSPRPGGCHAKAACGGGQPVSCAGLSARGATCRLRRK